MYLVQFSQEDVFHQKGTNPKTRYKIGSIVIKIILRSL